MSPKRAVKQTQKMKESGISLSRTEEDKDKDYVPETEVATEPTSKKRKSRSKDESKTAKAQKSPVTKKPKAPPAKGITLKEPSDVASKPKAVEGKGKTKLVLTEEEKRKLKKIDLKRAQLENRIKDDVITEADAAARFYNLAFQGEGPEHAATITRALYGFDIPQSIIKDFVEKNVRKNTEGASKQPHEALKKNPVAPDGSSSSDTQPGTPEPISKSSQSQPQPQPSSPQISTSVMPSFTSPVVRQGNSDFEYEDLVARREVEAKIKVAPRDFNQADLGDDQIRSCEGRAILRTVWTDVRVLGQATGFDLLQFFKQYEAWLLVHLPYSKKVVRYFYENLRSYVDRKDALGNFVEEQMLVTIRGQELVISPSSINQALGIVVPSITNVPYRSYEEIYQIFMGEGTSGELNHLKPSLMNNLNKTIYYIYSRMLVNKFNNYTHFTTEDYAPLASLISKDDRNVGEWLFGQLQRVLKKVKSKSPLPFPGLISLLLKEAKIWYLEKDDVNYIPPISREKNLLKAGIEVGTGLLAPRTQQGDEAQSSAPSKMPSVSRTPTPSHTPGISESGLAQILEAIQKLDQKCDNIQAQVTTQIAEVKEYVQTSNQKLLDMYDAGFQAFHDIHLDLKEEVENGSNLLTEASKRLDRKMDALLHALNIPSLGPSWPPTNARILEISSTSEVAKLFPEFITSEPTIRIPILPPIPHTTPMPSYPVHMTVPQPSPTPSPTPTPTPSQTPLTQETEPSTIPPPSTVNEQEPQASGDPINVEGSISFPKLSTQDDDKDDASSPFVADDKKGEKDKEEMLVEPEPEKVASEEEEEEEVIFDEKKLDEEIEKLFEEEEKAEAQEALVQESQEKEQVVEEQDDVEMVAEIAKAYSDITPEPTSDSQKPQETSPKPDEP